MPERFICARWNSKDLFFCLALQLLLLQSVRLRNSHMACKNTFSKHDSAIAKLFACLSFLINTLYHQPLFNLGGITSLLAHQIYLKDLKHFQHSSLSLTMPSHVNMVTAVIITKTNSSFSTPKMLPVISREVCTKTTELAPKRW